MAFATQDRWWALKGAERCAQLKVTCDNLERIHAPRKRRALRNIQIYEGRKLAGLHPYAYFSDVDLATDNSDMERINLARALVNTAMAKVAGKQKPKASFCVTDSDWSTKRKAKKLERFVEGQMMARQGRHHDAWSLGVMAFRDCCVTDWGVLKIWADAIKRAVVIERIPPWQLLFDPWEAQDGNPRNIFHVYPYDRDALIAQYPHAKAAILAAPPLSEEMVIGDGGTEAYGLDARVGRMIKVREAWRLPFSEDKPGVHSMMVGDVDLLEGEENEWTRDSFPFEILVWEPWMTGPCGTSLVDNVIHINQDLNAAVGRWEEAERLCSNGVFECEEGQVDEEQLTDNRVGIVVKRKPGTPPTTYTAPNAISSTSLQWISFLWGKGFEVPGISQQGATAQKEPGVDSGVAIRTVENIGSDRLAMPWQMYERVMAIGMARQIIACCHEMSEDGEDVVSKWPGAGFMKPIKLADVDLDEDQYIIQLQAVSGLVNTPTDRLQLASELLDRQAISMAAYLRIIQYKDIDSEIESVNAQSELVEKYIDSWKDATPEKADAGEFRYRPPIPFMGHEDAIVQVGRAYMEAELNDCPDYNLAFFLRFMADCDRKIQEKAQKAADMQAAANGKLAPQVPPGPPGGAPLPPLGGPPPMPAGLPPGQVMQ